MPFTCSSDAECQQKTHRDDVTCIHGICRCKNEPGYPECNCEKLLRPTDENECVSDFCNFNNFTGECGGGYCTYDAVAKRFMCANCQNNGNVNDQCYCFDNQLMDNGLCYAKQSSSQGLIWAVVILIVILIAVLSLWLYIKYGKAHDVEAQGVIMDVVRKDEREGLVLNEEFEQDAY